jgi:hypothetical protein
MEMWKRNRERMSHKTSQKAEPWAKENEEHLNPGSGAGSGELQVASGEDRMEAVSTDFSFQVNWNKPSP